MSSETLERAKAIRAAFSVLGITEHGGYSPKRQKAEDELAALLAEIARLEEHRSGLIKDHLRLRDELAAALEREQHLRENLAKIAEAPCTLNLAGKCVGAVHSRRKRYDNPERVEIVGCAAHFARAALMDEPAARESVSASAAADEPTCICPRFRDLPEGTIIADLTCPVHGVNGTDPGDVLPAEDAAADEPASAPACICGAAHGSWHSPECSAHLKAAYDAAADEPGEQRG